MSDQHYRDTLAEFHSAFGVEPYSKLTRTELLALVALRSTLIEEETRELLEALSDVYQMPTQANREHVAKEAADLLYVTAGASQLLGLPLYDPEPDHSGRSIPYFSAGTLTTASMDARRELDSLFVLIDQEYTDEDLSFALDDLAPTLQMLVDILFAFSDTCQIPLREVFDAVHASNMSKLDPTTRKPILRSDGKVLKGPGYFEPDLGTVLRKAA